MRIDVGKNNSGTYVAIGLNPNWYEHLNEEPYKRPGTYYKPKKASIDYNGLTFNNYFATQFINNITSNVVISGELP